MKQIKILHLLVLGLLCWSCAVAQTPEKEENKAGKAANKEIEACEPEPLTAPPASELKTLAEGANSRIETPFVFVARDSRTFELLKERVEGLPAASSIDFSREAVVAVFAGTKNTGGYSVEIKISGETVSASVAAPPADAVVTQALTSPFKVALVPVEEEKSLNLSVSDELKNGAKTFRVASGEFMYSGGFAPREKRFAAEGTILVMQAGDLVTLDFELAGKAAEDKAMKLTETASGILKDGKIELSRLDAGSFSEGPKPPVRVSGKMSENRLELKFEPLPTNVSDGFSVEGKLQAVND
jgi:hypothetical protein